MTNVFPAMTIRTHSGSSYAPALPTAIAGIAAASSIRPVAIGRVKGGYIMRNHGAPANGVHAPVKENEWPTVFDIGYGAPVAKTLGAVLETCLRFAKEGTA